MEDPIPSSPKSSIYVVYGAEDYHLDINAAVVRSWKGRDLRRLTLTDSGTDLQVLDLCSGNMSGDPITVLVDDASLVKESKSKALRSYVEDRSATDTSLVIVAVVRNAKLPALWEAVSAKATIVHCPKLKTFGEGTKNEVLTKEIRQKAVKYSLTFDDGVDVDFFRRTGGDLHRIHSEFRKLRVLASVTGNHKITQDILSKVVLMNPDVGPWQIAEYAFNKDRRRAMNLLSFLYEAEKEDAASNKVVSALIRELQSVIVARHLIDQGTSSDDLATLIGMHPYKCKEFFLPRVRKHDQKTLAGHMTRLCRLESDVKSRSVSKRTLVELAVLSISG